MLPEIKVYKIDWDFILENYTDKSLWGKKYNLFVYKDFVFTIQLQRIDVWDKELMFYVKCNKLQWSAEYITYSLENTPINVFMKQIKGAIFNLIETYERERIRESDGYKKILDYKWEERDKLREIAEEYLDECGVTNADIREPYIDKYISDNEKVGIQLSNYESFYKYNYCTELYLVYCKAEQDESRLQKVKNAVSNKNKLAILESEIEEEIKYINSSDYVEDMKDCLEGV